MRKGFSLVLLVLALSGWIAMAQIPRTLQIAVTNGTVTVASQTSSVAFFGDLETTTNLSSPIAWSGTISPILMTSVSSNFPATNSQTFFRLVQNYPIFEFAIFYNLNMEIDPGAPMFINGPVFSNAGIWAGTGNLTFNSTVSAVGQVNTSDTDPFVTGHTSSTPPPTIFNLAGQPISGVGALNLPGFGTTNAEAILNIPPPSYAMGTAAAYSTNGLAYLANAVDLVISNAITGTNILGGGFTPKGTNITIYFQDSQNVPILKKLTPDFYILKTPAFAGGPIYTNYVWPDTVFNRSTYTNRCATNVAYAGWSFVTNVAFYDYRESKTVQAVQIDVAKFNFWLTNLTATNGGGQYNFVCDDDKGHTIDSIWVYNNAINDSSTLPALRVISGIQLPNSWGLTVATPMPIYVYGDYNKQIDAIHVSSGTNTAYTYPAALMGDAVTSLSSSWSDSYNPATSLGSRNASSTTFNAAILQGIVKSSGVNYSGGVEQSLRFLEDWSGDTNTYNGSLVAMFPSIYATNYWQSAGIYYNPPKRNWNFDYNFLQQNKLPPLTPQVVNFATP
jgi:hypothetical protein